MKNNKLDYYMNLVPFLGETLGADYEITLQEVSEKKSHIIAIANGHISGRKIGSPLTDFALELIREKRYLTSNSVINYQGKSKKNQSLRSSTYFIKEDENLLGLLCINYNGNKLINLSRELSGVANELLNLANAGHSHEKYENKVEEVPSYVENFPESIADLINLTAGVDLTNHSVKLSSEDNLRIVKVLEQKGVFQLKGSIPEVASALKISEATLYRYLKKLS
ncbi:hypothetical protein IGI37_003766 [Enterococcus sp. AZ194]|uniref:helix-turn-helix transcriptional regulator n=1 Tax=Enterococcus sp. AZ194 TaxID=2774629 RepID=UPI003F28B346